VAFFDLRLGDAVVAAVGRAGRFIAATAAAHKSAAEAVDASMLSLLSNIVV
jgi:hypothetical protein